MKENPIFGIYEKALRPASFDRMFANAAQCGFDCFELSLDSTEDKLHRLDWTHEQIAEVRQASIRNGIRLLTTCLSAHKRFPLGSSDPFTLRQSMEIMRKAICLSGELGIRVIQVSGFDVYDQEQSTAQTRARFEHNLEKCVRMAERFCVMLAIEPVEGNLLTVRDTMRVVDRIASPWLQIYPDPANICSLGVEPIQDLVCGKGHIVAVHLRDSLFNCYDATIPFGTGNLDFEGVIRKLDELSFTGPMVVEMWNTEQQNDLEMIVQARTYLEKIISKVRDMDV